MKKIILASIIGMLLMVGCGNPNVKSSSAVKNGIKKDYNLAGKLRLEETYKNGKRDGIKRWWNYSGARGSGKLGEYGTTYYKEGLEHGVRTSYYEGGEVRTRCMYVNGKIEGLDQRWARDGRLLTKRNYLHGKKDGTKKEWYGNGQLNTISHFINGVEHGVRRGYFNNGKPSSIIPMINGKKDGIEKSYNGDGSLFLTSYWVKGELKKTRLSASEIRKAKERERRWAKKLTADKKSQASSAKLVCSDDSSQYSTSEHSSKIAIAKGKGEGAALGYQMSHGNALLSRAKANNYCVKNANLTGMACPYAKVYLTGCMSKLGH